MSRAGVSEAGFVTTDCDPAWQEKHASEGLVAQFQQQAAGSQVRSLLAADAAGAGSCGWCRVCLLAEP